MISDRISVLFQFIDFLHSNIDYFNSNVPLCEEVISIKKERNKFDRDKNYKDKLRYDELDKVLQLKFDILDGNVLQQLKSKSLEFKIGGFANPNDDVKCNSTAIRDLHENFDSMDVAIILEYQGKYLQYRTECPCCFFLDSFFSELDTMFKNMFDFFNDTPLKELEIPTIDVFGKNNLVEMIKSNNNNFVYYDKPNVITSVSDDMVNTNKLEGITLKSYALYNYFNIRSHQIEEPKIAAKAEGCKVDDILKKRFENDKVTFSLKSYKNMYSRIDNGKEEGERANILDAGNTGLVLRFLEGNAKKLAMKNLESFE